MSFRVLIADKLPAEGLEAFDPYTSVRADDRTGISAEDLADVIGDYDALVVRSRTKVTAELKG